MAHPVGQWDLIPVYGVYIDDLELRTGTDYTAEFIGPVATPVVSNVYRWGGSAYVPLDAYRWNGSGYTQVTEVAP